MKKFIVWSVFGFLSGCAVHPATYNASGISSEKLASLTAVETKTFINVDPVAMIVSVFDAEGKRIIGNSSFFEQDRWTEVFLEPGTYRIVANCSWHNAVAFPRATVVVEAGTKYQFKCVAKKIENASWWQNNSAAELVVEKL